MPNISIPIPGLAIAETRALRRISTWHDDYQNRLRKAKPDPRGLYIEPVTTKLCAERLKMNQGDVLAMLNRFEHFGLVQKRRRLSAGPTGYGWDGALHSEVIVTLKGKEELARYAAES